MQQAVHQCAVDRQLVVSRGLGGVHHQLLPEGTPVRVHGGELLRTRERLTVALAQPDTLDGQQGLASRAANSVVAEPI